MRYSIKFSHKIKLFTAICILALNVMGQENQQAFSFDEIQGNGSEINIEPRQFESYDKTKINYVQFIPDSNTIAKLIFIHGGGAHSKLGYFQLAQTLKDSFNIETLLIDLRGHGLSEGKRGDCPNMKSMYKDISSIIRIAKTGNQLPIYLGGHSSGGGLVLNYSSWKKKEIVNGYFFISPELGYKSNTDRENRIPFASVKTWKFIINGISQGLLLQHSNAIFFNYPKKVMADNPLILSSISVNMAKALTPNNPKKQFEKIIEPIAILIGEQDEMFEPQKVIHYANLPERKNNKTIAKILIDRKHLSILNDVGFEIGNTIKQWNE